MDTLEYLREIITQLSKTVDQNIFRLQAIWKISMAFKPNELELGYEDTVLVAYTTSPGASFCPSEPDCILLNHLGQDARLVPSENTCLQIAALDAAYANFRQKSDFDMILSGSIASKAYGRANIVVNEIHRISALKGNRNQQKRVSVLTIGSVGTIIAELVGRGFDVYGTDLDPTVIGSNMSGIIIQDGSVSTIELIKHVDIALVTGMSLATETFDRILETAVKADTKIVMFAQTGANFSPFLRDIGVDTVVSEFFPFYMFPGDSLVSIYRSHHELDNK